jgi:APA family basic amino acid/polyamine antiporter
MALKRVLGATDAAWLVAGNMIGAGIFLTPGFVAEDLPGAAWHMGAWLLGAVLALSGAAVYAELGARIPEAGGDYRYLSAAFGPVWGFVTGWAAFLLTFSGAAAAMAQVAVHHLLRAFSIDVRPEDVAPKVAASLIVLALTAANVAGARFSGRTTTILTALPLVGLAILFGYGLLSGGSPLRPPEDPFRLPDAAWPVALGAAMLPVFFTYSGWNAAAYVAGEVRDPGRNLPRGLLVGTALIAVVYLSVNAVLLFTLPHEELAGSTTAAAVAAKRLLNPAADRVLSLFIAFAILGSANVTLMAGARIYYAMARDRLAPATMQRENRAGVPSVALWIGGAWSATLAFVGTVGDLVEWTTLAILLLSALTVAGLFVLRRRGVGSPRYRCPGYPWVPLVYLGTTVAVAVASSLRDPRHSLWGLLFVLSGVPAYFLLHRALRRRD